MKKTILALSAALLCQAALAKGIEASNAYARATVGQQQSGAFVTLKNTDKTDNVLIGASVDKSVAETTELHTHINENGVMKMREVKDGVPLKAGEATELKPGSYHIMFFGLKKDLVAGQKFPVKLKFKNGKDKKVMVTVRDMQAMQHSHDAHGDKAHGEHNHQH